MRKTRLILILTLLCILIAAPAWAVPNESALKQQSSADISPTSTTMLMTNFTPLSFIR